MTPTGLTQLLQSTQTLFSDPASLGAGLDWVDRILPRFTDACIHDVTHGTPEAFAAWRDWLTGDSVEGIRDAGEEEVFVWRRTWLQILVSASEELYNAGGNRPAEGKKLAESLYAQAPYVFSFFPKVFWFDLVDMLSSTRKAVSHTPASIRTSFPLVLAERMVIDGDNIDVLLADFSLSPSGYSGGGLYLDPAQVAVRCIDGAFAPIFAQAVTEVSRYVAPDTLPSVRVQLTPLKPEHEIFLQTLILRGPSGGGALAAGLYCLFKSYQPHRTLATSFALTAPGQTTPDGFCHAVGGAYEKVRGCAKAGMQNLLVAEEAAGQVRFYGHLQNVSIVGASTLQDVFLYLDKSVETAPAEPINTDEDGGVLSLSSQLYIERRSDAAFHTALAQRPMIVLVKGARQIGKTSLLVRGVDQVRKSNVKLIYVDLQSIGRNNLKTQKDFFIAVARIFERELNLSVTMDELYDERDGPNKNFENFLFKYVLTSSVIWFMDEVDRLFDFDYYTDVFSLMRSWHNRRSVHRELGNLTLVLCYATETHLMIEDLYQSPFNVGTKIELEDFTPDQVAAFNKKVGSPLKSEDEFEEFLRLAGGQPHLVCRGLSWMASEGKSLEEFTAVASLDSGPFGSHLRRLLLVTRNPEQSEVLHNVLRGLPNHNHNAFLHLRSAGVLVGDDLKTLRVRCGIYADYLRRNLLPNEAESTRTRAKKSIFSQFFRRLTS